MALPDVTVEQAKALAGGPFGQTMLRNVGSYVVPINWPKSVEADGVELRNGTAFFVKTPRGLFGITAAHVVRGYLADKARIPGIRCGLVDSDTEIDLERDLIGMGERVDIATFRVDEHLVARINRQVTEMPKKQPLTAWPPVRLQVGQGVLYAGFPGAVRQRMGRNHFSFGLCVGGGLADDVEDQRIVTAIKHEELVDTLGHGLPPEDFEFGGMSGGPVLAVVETGIYSWSLAGVISRGSTLGGGMLIAAPATCLQDDGAILE